MKPFRIPVLTLIVVALAATVSLAGPSSSNPPSREGDGGAPGSEPPAREEQVVLDDDAGVAPDHSGCEGLTGLENAVCRVGANLEAHPNRGLENALSRLEEHLSSRGENGHGPPERVEAPGLAIAASHGAAVTNG